MFLNPWFVSSTEWRSDMPFADMRRVVAIRLENFRDCHLALQQVHVMHVILNHRIDAGPYVLAARQ
jgi:hypothetical protein